MRKKLIPLSHAIVLFLVGAFIGSVFIFGVQYWNASVTREECRTVETQFVSYRERHQPKRPIRVKEIAINCANSETYYIDGVSVNTELRNALSAMAENEDIVLLIHPKTNTIVEFFNKVDEILSFDETAKNLDTEKNGFFYLGLFMYVCSLCGLYCIVLHIIKIIKVKSRK